MSELSASCFVPKSNREEYQIARVNKLTVVKLIVQDDAQKRAMDFQSTVVVDEAKFQELVHEEAANVSWLDARNHWLLFAKAAAPSHSPLQEHLSNSSSSPPFESSAEVAPDRSDAIRAIISPALLRSSIFPTSDGSVYGSGCTR